MRGSVTPQTAFDQYHQAVYSFLYRMTRHPDVAEDLTQECFLALVRAPERFDAARGGMKTYLFAIARNLALKHYRDFRGEGPLEDTAVFNPSAAFDAASSVAAAIAALPPLQQEAIILFEYEGVTL